MFEATIQPDRLQETIEPATVLVDECRLHLRKDEVVIRAADAALVALVELSLPASAFDSYRSEGTVIGVDLEQLLDVVRVADDGLLNLELDTERRKLVVESGNLSYTLGLIDPDAIREDPDLPEIEPPASVALEGADLDRGIEAADMVADYLRLRVDEHEESFRIEAEGDTDDVDLELTREQVDSLSVGTADSLYSLDYLREINRAIPNDSTVELDLGEEFLVRLQYERSDSGPHVSYRVAPRIQSA